MKVVILIQSYRVDLSQTTSQEIAQILWKLIDTYHPTKRDIVLLCIGSDRSTGDAFGPLVGTFLQEEGGAGYEIIGTLSEPIHAKNIEQTIQNMQQTNPETLVISIDAGLGTSSQVGSLFIGLGALRPGKAVDKQITSIGDLHIIGIVNRAGQQHVTLQSSRLSLVYSLAKLVSSGLISLSRKLNS